MESKFKYIIRRVARIIKDVIYYDWLINSGIKLFGVKDKRKMKYNVSLCLIFNNEAAFLKEWIDYHLTVGIDHFYLYNNNSTDNYEEVLRPYVDDDIVTLIEWPGCGQQFIVYQNFYETFRNESNWISFLDADEFIVPRSATNIKEWIKSYSKYPSIMVNWLMFGTGGILEHDYGKNVIEQYFACSHKLFKFGKCFINTRFDIADFNSWHIHHNTYMKYPIYGLELTVPSVNQFFHIYGVSSCRNIVNKDNASITINHYFTKSWENYSKKMHKSDVLFDKNPKADYSYFYKYEDDCLSRDFSIQRFFIRMKINQKYIK